MNFITSQFSRNDRAWLPAIALYGSLYLLLFLLLPDSYHKGDMGHWQRWMVHMLEHGIGKVYEYGPGWRVNYPPLYLYCLYAFGWLQGSAEAVVSNMSYVRGIALAFDFLGAFAIWHLVKDYRQALYLPLFLLLNIAYLYNSVFWGQCDSIPTALLAWALVFALRAQIILAMLTFLLAMNAKLVVLVIAPVLALLLWPVIYHKPKQFASGLSLCVLVQLLLILPFLFAGQLANFWEHTFGSIDQYTNISLKAYNLWYLLLGPAARWTHSPEIIYGLSYKSWSYLLFFPLAFLALLPLLFQSWQLVKKRLTPDADMVELGFLSSLLCVLLMFFFAVHMHERYSHASMLLAFLYACTSGRFVIFLICCLAYLLNLESSLQAFNYPNYKVLIFDYRFIAGLFALAILLAFWQLRRHPSAKMLRQNFGRWANKKA